MTTLSASGATLDTGRWLALTRSGLAPDKKRQAFLGALTVQPPQPPQPLTQQEQVEEQVQATPCAAA